MSEKKRSIFEELDLLELNDPQMMHELSKSPNRTTRLSVAGSTITTKETLMEMAETETNTSILQAILDNPSTTDAIKVVIASRGNSLIALTLADSGNRKIEAALMSSHPSPLVLQRIATTTTDKHISEQLWHSDNFFVKCLLMRRFPKLRKLGLEDSNPYIRGIAKKLCR